MKRHTTSIVALVATVVGLVVVLGTVRANAQVVLLDEDFDSYSPGGFPVGWDSVYSGDGWQYQVVTNSQWVSSPNSFTMLGRSGNSAVVNYGFASPPQEITYSGRVRVAAGAATANIAAMSLWNKDEATWGTYYCQLRFGDTAIWLSASGVSAVHLQSYNREQWYHWKVEYDAVARTASVWIDNVQVGSNVTLNQGGLGYKGLALASEHGAKQCWYDDIYVTKPSVAPSNLTLDDVEGLDAGSNIPAGGSVKFIIGLSNTTSASILGFTTGFRVYSPDGALYDPIVLDTMSLGWPTMFDLAFQIVYFSADGLDADTVGVGAAVSTGPGIPDGFDQQVWWIETAVDPSSVGMHLCLDSSFYPPSGQWVWVTPSAVYPTWGGPYCFEIVANLPPIITNNPGSLVFDHCDLATYDFDATDPEGGPLWFTLISGVGALDSATGVWQYTPVPEDVWELYTLGIEVCDEPGACDTAFTEVTFTNEPPFFTSGCNDTAYGTIGEIIEHQLTADQADCDPLTFSIVGIVPWPSGPATMDPASGLFSFEPDSTDVDTFTVTVEVYDGLDPNACEFYVVVNPPGDIPGLYFYQLDLILDDIPYTDLDWGELDLTLTPQADTDMVYLNVTVNGSWQVQDIPLWPPTADEGSVTVGIGFDLGVPSGTSIDWVTYGYSLTSAPLGGPPAETDSTVVADRQVVMNSGAPDEVAQAPGPAGPAVGGAAADPVKHAHKDSDFPNQDCGVRECIPAAVSNSLKFLNKKHNMGLDDNDLEIEDMKTATHWGEKDIGGGQTVTGAWHQHDNNRPEGERNAWWQDKKAYMEKNKIPVTTKKIDSLSKVAAEIDAGQDVELQVPGHVAAVVSIIDLGGGKYKLEVKHDTKQGPNGNGGLDKQAIIYNPTTKKFEGGWCIDDRTLIDLIVECPKVEPTMGTNRHSEDDYIPPDGDPTGTLWHELWPNYCVMWEITDWEDNGDGVLSFCDYVTFTNQETQEESREHIEEVTATITVVPVDKQGDTTFLDFWYGRPDMDPIIPEEGDLWHEIWPEYCTMHEVLWWEDNGSGYLDSCDNIGFLVLTGPDSGTVQEYHVVAIGTDVISTPAPPPTCCIGIRGNIDYDPEDMIDISDLVYLVDYMFNQGPEPPCIVETDVDGSGGIDISDLVYLVDYMFTGGLAPVECPIID